MSDFGRVSRRDSIKLGTAVGSAAGAVTLGSRRLLGMEQDLGGNDFCATTGAEREAVPFTCPACNTKDRGVAFVENGRVKLGGNMDHPNTRGKPCAKGNAGFLHVYDPDRIMNPLLRTGKRGEGKWKRISYEEATAMVAKKLREVIDRAIAAQDASIANEIVFKWGHNRTGGACERFMHALGSNAILDHTDICESSK